MESLLCPAACRSVMSILSTDPRRTVPDALPCVSPVAQSVIMRRPRLCIHSPYCSWPCDTPAPCRGTTHNLGACFLCPAYCPRCSISRSLEHPPAPRHAAPEKEHCCPWVQHEPASSEACLMMARGASSYCPLPHAACESRVCTELSLANSEDCSTPTHRQPEGSVSGAKHQTDRASVPLVYFPNPQPNSNS